MGASVEVSWPIIDAVFANLNTQIVVLNWFILLFDWSVPGLSR